MDNSSTTLSSQLDPLLVETASGLVRGVEEKLKSGMVLRSWRGVPYGETTGGQARFSAPTARARWEGVRDCSDFGEVAAQPTYSWTDRVIGGEDCLNLDIVRPDNDEVLPVVVYLHGGSFIVGSSHMLMLRGFELSQTMGVVYVSVNFRLGALGFLDVRSLDGEACANPALADQLLALRWVRENIAAFGGDPANVTLMGESAGGSCVLALMTSPQAEGLFHRAIAQSPPIATVHSKTQSTFWARQLVEKLALPRMSGVDKLREQDYEDIIRAGQSMIWRAGEMAHLNAAYAPTVDGDILVEHPLAAFEGGRQMKVPLLVGTNSDEASFGKFLLQRQFARRRAGLRLLSSFDASGAGQVVQAYGGASTRADFARLLADALFWGPTVRVADAHARVAPTYMYRFDFAPTALRMLGLGAVHSLELSHIFGDPQSSRMSVLTRVGSTEDFDELTTLMQQYWATFIHSGCPGGAWPLYDCVERNIMVFDSQWSIESDPDPEKRRAWENLNMEEWGASRADLTEALSFLLDGLE